MWFSCSAGKEYGSVQPSLSIKAKHTTSVWPSIYTPRYVPREMNAYVYQKFCARICIADLLNRK